MIPATTSSVLMRFRSMANFKHIVTRTANIISVFYYYYFRLLGQLYDGLSELGLGALFCRLALFAVAMILSIVSGDKYSDKYNAEQL